MKKSVENELLPALTQLAETVKTMPAANPKPSLLPIFARLDELTHSLPAGTSPQSAKAVWYRIRSEQNLFLFPIQCQCGSPN